ncbi:MAG: hypothetical protein DMF94_15010 [Acidobacteria bacterium]|nr:MAG: hypothetical protein DMF94_15010 [Acidobacteriota bacterium]
MEWLPVVTGAFAIGSLIVPFLVEVTASYLRPCAAVLGIQAVVGVIGFGFHLSSVVHQPAATWFEKILSGAPPMAPLLFPNLSVLAGIALWVLAVPKTAETAGKNLGYSRRSLRALR